MGKEGPNVGVINYTNNIFLKEKKDKFSFYPKAEINLSHLLSLSKKKRKKKIKPHFSGTHHLKKESFFFLIFLFICFH